MNNNKDLLYKYFDVDQTYDIIIWDNIAYAANTLLRAGLADHGIFDDQYSPMVTFIERFTPVIDAEHKWCEDWTEKFYPFIQKLSRTGVLDDDTITGYYHAQNWNTPQYERSTPEGWSMPNRPYVQPPPIPLDDYKTDTITVTVPKDTTAYITWIQNAHTELKTSNFAEKNRNRINIFMRKSKILHNPDKELPKDFTLKTANWLHNSVVLPDIDELETDLTETQKKFWMYDKLEEFTDYLWEQLQFPDPIKVLTAITVKSMTQVKANTPYMVIWPNSNHLERYYEPYSTFAENRPWLVKYTNYKNPVFTAVPDSYYKALWYKAVKPDDTTPLTEEDNRLRFMAWVDGEWGYSSVDFEYENFFSVHNYDIGGDYWPDKVNTPSFVLEREGIEDQDFTLESKKLSIPYTRYDAIYRVNRQFYVECNYYFTSRVNDSCYSFYSDIEDSSITNNEGTVTDYNGITQPQTVTSKRAKKTFLGDVHSLGLRYYDSYPLDNPGYYGKTYYQTLAEVEYTSAVFIPEDPKAATPEDVIRISSSKGRGYSNGAGFIQYALSPSNDWHLFRGGEIAWVRNQIEFNYSLEFTTDSVIEIGGDSASYVGVHGTAEFSNVVNADVYIVKFTISGDYPPNFTVSHEIIKDERIEMENKSYSGPFWHYYPQSVDNNWWYLQNYEEVTLTRTLRQTPLPTIYTEA